MGVRISVEKRRQVVMDSIGKRGDWGYEKSVVNAGSITSWVDTRGGVAPPI